MEKPLLRLISSFISSKDERYFIGQNANDDEAQLVAEAIAASMRNRQKIDWVRYILCQRYNSMSSMCRVSLDVELLVNHQSAIQPLR
jgi:hypothetical protein